MAVDLFICGLDEAGRGPMAGPVCAASVILPHDFPVEFLDDSKKLSEKKREEAMIQIYSKALAWSVGWASADEIDSINILQASLLAMKRAYVSMLKKLTNADLKHRVVIDGLFIPELPGVDCIAIPKADALYPSVMAASILAKTARDKMMIRYSWFYPEYGYERHKGYPTKAHIDVLKEKGPSPIQRNSFRLKNEGQLYLL